MNPLHLHRYKPSTLSLKPSRKLSVEWEMQTLFGIGECSLACVCDSHIGARGSCDVRATIGMLERSTSCSQSATCNDDLNDLRRTNSSCNRSLVSMRDLTSSACNSLTLSRSFLVNSKGLSVAYIWMKTFS